MTVPRAAVLAVLLSALSGCGERDTGSAPPSPPAPQAAIAVVVPAQGKTVSGAVRFHLVADGVAVVADVDGLSPGKHGFHIHEFGDGSAADLASAGGHFNPTGAAHGGPASPAHHIGDLGNLVADDAGHAHLESTLHGASIAGVLGRSVIIHEKEDDLATQPSGNSGARIAIGVIGVAKP